MRGKRRFLFPWRQVQPPAAFVILHDFRGGQGHPGFRADRPHDEQAAPAAFGIEPVRDRRLFRRNDDPVFAVFTAFQPSAGQRRRAVPVFEKNPASLAGFLY